MISITRAAAIAVIVLCTITAVNAEDTLKDNKINKTAPKYKLECINIYPNDMLEIVRKGDGFLTPYKPMYLGYSVYSDRKDNGDMKFQISFKYNLGKDLFLGYTQKSLWNVKKTSAPVKETDYAPELMYIHNNDDCNFGVNTWLPYQFLIVGLRHESNGVSGINSHGWNMAYIEPYFALPQYKNLVVAPALWYPYTSKKNEVLRDDIGIGKLTVKWQHFKLFQLAAEYRHSLKNNKYGFEGKMDIFLGQGKDWFTPTLFVLGWKGYGETLGTHALNTSRVLVGFSVSR